MPIQNGQVAVGTAAVVIPVTSVNPFVLEVHNNDNTDDVYLGGPGVTTSTGLVLEKLEDAFSALLVNDRSFIKFNLNSLIRADFATRMAGYSTALASGWMSVNDVRTFEDLRPVDEGDQYRVPLQNIPLTDAPVITVSEKARAAQALTSAGFTGDSVAALLDLDVQHTGALSVQVQPEATEGDA